MKDNKNKGVIAILLSALLVVVLFFTVNNTGAKDKTVENAFYQEGSYLQEHPDHFKYCLQTLDGNKKFSKDEVIAWVNDIPITKIEFELRKGVKQKPDKIQDNSVIFNILVEEKIILDKAKNNNLIPSDQEVDTQINYLKQQYQTDNELKAIVDNYCKTSDMPLEDYWNDYSRYHEFRSLVLQKVYDATINKAKEAGELEMSDKVNYEELNKLKEYWKSVKLNWKNEAYVEINPAFSNLELRVNNTELSSIID